MNNLNDPLLPMSAKEFKEMPEPFIKEFSTFLKTFFVKMFLYLVPDHLGTPRWSGFPSSLVSTRLVKEIGCDRY